ncbi:hypothetical protein BVX94_01195 [bacterium B17]|nr:hypothetical protein BVX94_01195 [bacterium B17]
MKLKQAVVMVCVVCAVTVQANAGIAVEKGEKIAFLGDSITQAGNRSGGYVQLVVGGLNGLGLEVTHHGAGISGHKSNDMLRRLQRDVIDKKPNWMTLSCGVNDVWHNARGRGVDLPNYKKNITEIVDKAQAAGIKVMILTSTMIQEDQQHKLNQALIPYNEFLRELAKEKKCLLADLNADMQAQVKEAREKTGSNKNHLTGDGVHMNAAGNKMMALGVLRAFGLSDKQMAKVDDAWMNDITAVHVRPFFSVSKNEEKKFREKKKGHIGQALEKYMKENRDSILKEIMK